MNSYILGHRAYCTQAQTNLSPEVKQKISTTIDTVSASKKAVCEYLRDNPDATAKMANAFADNECTAISRVNDHLGIGIPMNSFRFTLRASLYHYYNTLIPEIAYHPFRVGAFSKFIEDHREVLLVFPVARGLTITVGELQFSVNRMNTAPTFIEFVEPDLSKVNMFYTLDKSSIRRLSEFQNDSHIASR